MAKFCQGAYSGCKHTVRFLGNETIGMKIIVGRNDLGISLLLLSKILPDAITEGALVSELFGCVNIQETLVVF